MVTVRPFKFDQDALVVFLSVEQLKSRELPVKDAKLSAEFQKVMEAGVFEAVAGSQFPAILGRKIVLFVGLGKTRDLSLSGLRIAVRRALLSAPLSRTESVELILPEDNRENVEAAIEGALIGTYAWKKYVTRKKDDRTVEHKKIFIAAKEQPGYAATAKVAANVNFARALVNENADVTDAVYLEKVMKDIVSGHKNVKLEILGRKELLAKGFGLLLAVNQGSNKKPRVLIASYTGAPGQAYTAVIGKGLTYDTGGLNLKPTGHMETMRCDMSGAAAVLSLLKTVLELGIKKNIIFACGVAENAISANAYKPGDVLTSLSGKTIEVGNTDAEGRLVLADVISYVIQQYKPARLIDLATLTGAVSVALGNDYSGLVSNDDALAEALLKSSALTDDRIWRLPSYPELREAIKSKIADLRNTSSWRGAGGTITGAEFLRQFVGDTPWAHLDIAGTAFVEGDGRMYFGHGATGAGVRLLTHYFINN